MIRCLCCNKVMKNPDEYERSVCWHKKCIRKFFDTDKMPELDLSDGELERLADQTVNRGLTVPGVQKKLSLHLECPDLMPRLTIVDYPTGFILKPRSEEFPCLHQA